MKHFKIVHRETGLTLRQYVKKYSFKALNAEWTCRPDNMQYEKIHYVIGEKGAPGFYYQAGYDGTVLLWLDRNEFQIELVPQQAPQPDSAGVPAGRSVYSGQSGKGE